MRLRRSWLVRNACAHWIGVVRLKDCRNESVTVVFEGGVVVTEEADVRHRVRCRPTRPPCSLVRAGFGAVTLAVAVSLRGHHAGRPQVRSTVALRASHHRDRDGRVRCVPAGKAQGEIHSREGQEGVDVGAPDVEGRPPVQGRPPPPPIAQQLPARRQ